MRARATGAHAAGARATGARALRGQGRARARALRGRGRRRWGGRARLELLLVHGAELLELLLLLLGELRAQRLHLILLGGDALVVRGGQLGQLVLLLLLHHTLDLLDLRVLDLLQLLAPVAHLRHLILPIAQRLLQPRDLLLPRHERALLLLQAALQRLHLLMLLVLMMRVLVVHASAVAAIVLQVLLVLLMLAVAPLVRSLVVGWCRHILGAAWASPLRLRLRLRLCQRGRRLRGSARRRAESREAIMERCCRRLGSWQLLDSAGAGRCCRLSSGCRLKPSGSPAQPIALCLISLLPPPAVGLWRLPESLLMLLP